jgi:hypothetical protein
MEHTTVDGLCDAFMLCADFLLNRSWEKRISSMSGETNTKTFLEKAYNILAVIVMKAGSTDYPMEGPVSPLLRERVFVGKIPLEMSLTCQLCLDDIDLCCSRVFFSCPCNSTLISSNALHVSCFLSFQLSKDNFPGTLATQQWAQVGRNLRCTHCVGPLLDSIVCLFPHRRTNSLGFTLEHLEDIIFPKPDIPHLNVRKQRRLFVRKRHAALLKLVEKSLECCPHEKELVVQLCDGKSFCRDPFPDYVAAFNEASPIDLTEEDIGGGGEVEGLNASRQHRLDNDHVFISVGDGPVDERFLNRFKAELSRAQQVVHNLSFLYQPHQTRSSNDVQFPIPLLLRPIED